MKCDFRLICLIIWSMVLLTAGVCADDRDQWQQPEKVMNAIGVKPGMVIGEPGAGRGFFTLKLARKVGPAGKIYANDIVDSCLDTIKEKSKTHNLKNIVTIKGELKDPLFPENSLDMAFMCYVLHDITYPVEFLKNLKPALKPGATLVILERDPIKVPSAANHFFSREKLKRVVKNAGYTLVRTETFLSKDNIYIYRVTGTGTSGPGDN